ncbi:MAG TPA: trehalase family glycosidase [Solirubrobacteraceae bacterium]|jgi:putative isomerase
MTILPDRAWSTWDQRFPACVMHVPSRFAVRVALFSATENRYDPFDAENQLAFELGEHTVDGDYVALRVRSAGTTLSVEFAKGEWSGVSGRVRIEEPGEMLFRLGIMVEAGFLAPDRADPREPVDRMVDTPVASHGTASGARGGGTRELTLLDAGHLMGDEARGRWRSQWFQLAVAPVPALSGQYERPADVADDLEHRGWLYHPPPRPDGDWVACRFYGNPRETITFAVSQETDAERAAVAARARLRDVEETIDEARARALAAGPPAARAVRDVMAWNTVWDDAHQRPYTALSRAWLRGFGGWGIWMSDAFYNALLCTRAGDPFMARANLHAVLSGQQAAGNLACLVGGDEEWIDRTQLPVGAFMVWRTYLLSGDRTLLADAYPVLRRHLEWVARERDGNGNGLYEYGSSPTGVAQGTFTKQGALNESGMDNLAVFDEAVFRSDTHTIDLEEPGHNSLLALEWEMLGLIAREIGRPAPEVESHFGIAQTIAQRISRELWDPEREIFAARRWDGTFAAHVSPTSFFPLVARAATGEQIDAMLRRHLLSESEFWGPLPLPTAPFSDEVNTEDSYWRGRIWPPMNFWVWEGLRRAGRHEAAAELSRRSWEMYEAEWSEKRHSHENFNSRDPAAHEAHDSDPFYSWGALIPFIYEAERADVSPWDGLCLGDPSGADAALELGGRSYRVCTAGERMSVLADGHEELAVSPPARVSRLVLTGEMTEFHIDGEPVAVELPRRVGGVVSITVDGEPRIVEASGEGSVHVPAVRGRVRVQYEAGDSREVN